MQEMGGSWQPVTDGAPLVWEARLFVLYSFLAIAFLLLISVGLIKDLWRTRTTSAASSNAQGEIEMLRILKFPAAKIAGLKRAAVFTVLFSSLMLLDGVVRILHGISIEETTGYAALAHAMAEVLTVFGVGIAVSTALYASYGVFDGVFARRKVAWECRAKLNNYQSGQSGGDSSLN